MVDISQLRFGSVIEDSMGNRKRVVDIGDDVEDNVGISLMTEDSAGRPAIHCNNITGRGMSIVRLDRLDSFELVHQ